VNLSPKDRHLIGAGAAACAVCCAAPLLTVLGLAGAMATVATFVFAGVVFGLVVAAGAVFAVWKVRRQARCAPSGSGSVEVELSSRPTASNGQTTDARP
jgi:hypothetical protein